MKVYVLVWNSFSNSGLSGIYQSRESADNEAFKLNCDARFILHTVEEHEVKS